jgi:hypothetical protein
MSPADAKDAAGCCAQHDMQSKDGKQKASCCARKGSTSDAKDAMSGMRDSAHKTASCCSKDGGKESCGKDCCTKDKTASAGCKGKDGKGCCSGKKLEKTAKMYCKEELHS